MGRRTYCLTLSYDGTRYRGWQRLPNTLTVQGTVEKALSEIFDQPIEINGSGRTDAGVHAKEQVASFCAPEYPTKRLLSELRKRLPSDIGAQTLCFAPERFHARLSATQKTYTYRIHNSDTPDIFMRKYRVSIEQKLDVEEMRLAAQKLCGTHDFIAFCSNKHYKKSSVRTVKEIRIEQEGENLTISMTADGFLYNMARILVGTLVEIGLHQRKTDTIDEIFASKRRENAGETAPARGLCLTEVRYEHTDFRQIEML